MDSDGLYLRIATIEDARLLYEWRNDSLCRENSINSDKITYDSHYSWFLDMINSDECNIFICMKNDKPVGQVRIDYNNKEGKVSYSVSSDYRGNGYGIIMLKLLEQDKLVWEKVIKLSAVVKYNNIASQKCFEKMQYLKEYHNGLFYYSKILQDKG